jgi:ectoine hydroxylase-related dioxygenase (phytanoyl-CoA dioxygenase family)
VRIEIATVSFLTQKLRIHSLFLYFWNRKWFRNLINLPRRIVFQLTGRRKLAERSDASEIKKISADLKVNGIAITHIDKLHDMPSIAELQKEYEILLEIESKKPHSRKSKAFIERLIDDDYDFESNRDSAIHRFVSNPALKLISENYLKLVPKLTSFKIWRSHFTGDPNRTASQNWHRDYNEFQMVRVFLYFNEVGRENGAGEYVIGTHYLGDSYGILEYSEELGTYATDEEIEQNFSVERIVCATGTPGTLVFMDTAGLHRGGYHSKPSERRVSLLTFSTAADIMPTKLRLKHLARKS